MTVNVFHDKWITPFLEEIANEPRGTDPTAVQICGLLWKMILRVIFGLCPASNV